MWEPEAGRGSRCTFRERYGVSLRGGGWRWSRKREGGGGGWVATVPCQALRGRLFIPWICIFYPLPFLTSYYPASMISSVGSLLLLTLIHTRSSLRVHRFLNRVRMRVCVYVHVCMCVGGWMDGRVHTRRRVGEFAGFLLAARRRMLPRLCVSKSNTLARKSSLSLSLSLSPPVRVYTFESCE